MHKSFVPRPLRVSLLCLLVGLAACADGTTAPRNPEKTMPSDPALTELLVPCPIPPPPYRDEYMHSQIGLQDVNQEAMLALYAAELIISLQNCNDKIKHISRKIGHVQS